MLWHRTRARAVLAAVYEVLRTVVREHRLVLTLSAAYISLGGAVLLLLGRAWPIALTNRYLLSVWAGISGLWLVWQYMRSPRRFKRAIAPTRLLGALLVLLIVVPTQITFQALKQSIGPVIGFRADPFLHRLDVVIHGRMPWEWLTVILDMPRVVRFVDVVYVCWFTALFGFVFWASWSQYRALRQRVLLALLLLWIGAGTFGAALAASVGPCYYGETVGGANPYAGLTARLDAIDREDYALAARFNQRGLWQLRQRDEWGHFGGISAMPSLHVGVAVLMAMTAWSRSKVLGALLAVNAAVIQVGSVLLAWHYAIDGYAGALCAVAAWKAAGRWTDREGLPTAAPGADPSVARAPVDAPTD